MSVFDHIETRATGDRKPILGGLRVTARTLSIGGPRNDESLLAYEYETRLVTGVRFWANKAEYDLAKHNSEILLLRHLHKDVLHASALIKSAVLGHDQEAALEACAELEKALGL